MNFRTQIPINKELHQINYDSTILMLGSCFTEHIGNKLKYFKFQHKINPFGILFHPKAIETFFTNCINSKEYDNDAIFQQNEQWHCFDAHSDVSSESNQELLNNLNAEISSTRAHLKNASHLIISLGTAWVYRHIASDTIVANCHKVPQKKFLKELLTVDEIVSSLEGIIALIKSVNPEIQFIFTVSPVRHLKDGFVENSRSKAHLLAAIHQVVEPRTRIHYFPSYEIMLDDLRDYRFYTSDMLHPNETAIEYIWDAFKTSWIAEDSAQLMKEVAIVQKGLAHKAFHPTSEKHQLFLADLALKKDKLKEKNILF